VESLIVATTIIPVEVAIFATAEKLLKAVIDTTTAIQSTAKVVIAITPVMA
jgi:hypothetical protein